jgi:hypothetical protein
MRILDRYRKVDPLPVTVTWPSSAAQVLAAIGAAIAVEYLAPVAGDAWTVYRLQGSVTGRMVSLRVSLSGTHLGAWPYYTLTGDVRDVGQGSEFRGGMIVPGAASGTWILVLAASVVIGVLLVVAGMPEVLPVWAFGFVTLLFAPEIRSRVLRRRARDVAAILASITSVGAPAPAP